MGDSLFSTNSSTGTVTLTRGCSRRSCSGVGMNFASAQTFPFPSAFRHYQKWFKVETRSKRLIALPVVQLRVLCLGLFENGNIRVGVFPEREEVLIGSASSGCFVLHGVCTGQSEAG